MYNPFAPTLAAADDERKIVCNEFHDMRDHTKKKEGHVYPVKSPAKFNQAVTPFSPV